MKIILTFLMVILLSLKFNAQKWDVQISGTITEINSTIPISGVSIRLFENNNLLDSLRSDSFGKYSINTIFDIQNEYSLEVKYVNYRIEKVTLKNTSDTSRMGLYQIDMSFFKRREHKFDNSAYFEFNEIEEMLNFEPEWLKSLLDENPDLCLTFIQTINPKENSRIAKKRMAYFTNALIEAKCDMNRISFSTDILYLNEETINLDNRSRIQGLITSMDGDCK